MAARLARPVELLKPSVHSQAGSRAARAVRSGRQTGAAAAVVAVLGLLTPSGHSRGRRHGSAVGMPAAALFLADSEWPERARPVVAVVAMVVAVAGSQAMLTARTGRQAGAAVAVAAAAILPAVLVGWSAVSSMSGYAVASLAMTALVQMAAACAVPGLSAVAVVRVTRGRWAGKRRTC